MSIADCRTAERAPIRRVLARIISVIIVSMAGLAARPAQGPELNAIMREKLGHAQKILEAVVTDDWPTIELESRRLELLTNDLRWTALKYPEYARHSRAFVQALQHLHRSAAQRDREKTPAAYLTVTLKCVECHRYLARARMTK